MPPKTMPATFDVIGKQGLYPSSQNWNLGHAATGDSGQPLWMLLPGRGYFVTGAPTSFFQSLIRFWTLTDASCSGSA
jgi:hypothetical protein